MRGMLLCAELSDVEVVVCPPFPWLTGRQCALVEGTPIKLGAQNPTDAETAARSPARSRRACSRVCASTSWSASTSGGSLFAEKDAHVRRKLQVAQQHGLKPILCIGETADHLDEGLGPYVVAEQIEADLEGVTLDSRLVIAYDPVWTTMGLVAPPPLSYVSDMVAHIRETLASVFSPQAAEQVRVIYGGSVNARNIAEIAADPRLDGVLTGATSTSADNFANVVRAFSGRQRA